MSERLSRTNGGACEIRRVWWRSPSIQRSSPSACSWAVDSSWDWVRSVSVAVVVPNRTAPSAAVRTITTSTEPKNLYANRSLTARGSNPASPGPSPES